MEINGKYNGKSDSPGARGIGNWSRAVVSLGARLWLVEGSGNETRVLCVHVHYIEGEYNILYSSAV